MKRICPILSWYNFILDRLHLSIANTFNDFPWILEKPDPPLNFKAQSATADSIYLTWAAPKTNAISGTIFYRVHYQCSNKNRFSINASTFTVFMSLLWIKFSRVNLLITSMKQRELQVSAKVFFYGTVERELQVKAKVFFIRQLYLIFKLFHD